MIHREVVEWHGDRRDRARSWGVAALFSKMLDCVLLDGRKCFGYEVREVAALLIENAVVSS
jgi:hypothetical protein